MDSKTPLKSKKINLIPSELAVPAEFVKITKVLNKISIVVASLLLIAIVIFGGLFYYFSSESQKVESINTQLKTKITNLQVNEQKLVLAKDRIAKIKIVQDAKSLGNEMKRFKSFSELLADGTELSITEASLASTGAEVTILAKTIEDLTLLMSKLPNLSFYDTVIVTSLGYNSNNGYVINLDLEKTQNE